MTRLYEVWTPKSSASENNATVARSRGLRFWCNGALQLPPTVERYPPWLALLALSVSTGLWALIVALAPLHWGFVGVGIAVMFGTWASMINVLLSDPGVLPKHVTALPGLLPRMAPPAYARAIDAPTANISIDGHVESCKFCISCRIWRPPTAHHCSRCNVCIEGFDHHCGILGKCVGQRNIRDFLIFLWMLVLVTVYGTAYCVAGAAVRISEEAQRMPSDVERPWATSATQVGLWVAGGVMLGLVGLCACTGSGLRRCWQTMCGAALVVLLSLIGFMCLLAGYVLGAPTGLDCAGKALPALIGIPVFLYLFVFAIGTAMGQTCLVATQMTTKQQLSGIVGVHGAAAPMHIRFRNVMRVLFSRVPSPHVDFRAEVGPLKAAIQQVEKQFFERAQAKQQAELAAWKDSQGKTVESAEERTQSTQSSVEVVVSVADPTVATEVVPESGTGRAQRSSQSASSSSFMAAHYPALAQPGPPGSEAGGSDVTRSAADGLIQAGTHDSRPASALCHNALMLSIDSCLLQDAIEMAQACAAAWNEANPTSKQPARKGVLVGLDFLPLPTMTWPQPSQAALVPSGASDAAMRTASTSTPTQDAVSGHPAASNAQSVAARLEEALQQQLDASVAIVADESQPSAAVRLPASDVAPEAAPSSLSETAAAGASSQ